MRGTRRLQFVLLTFAVALSGCRVEESPSVVAAPSPPRQAATLDGGRGTRPGVEGAGRDDSRDEVRPPSPVVERTWGKADKDPDNDGEVAPPDAVPECQELLQGAGIDFLPASLPLKQIVSDIPTCGCHDAVTVRKAPSGMRLSPPAVMSCQLALALPDLDQLIQELAQRHLGERVTVLHQGGTYSCRKMARFDLVSEHSYGNAIDVRSFTTESGKNVSVLSHYGALSAPVESLPKQALFLREVASGAYDRDLVSVSLSPYWDALHRDHFHFDMARYRVDGTRPR